MKQTTNQFYSELSKAAKIDAQNSFNTVRFLLAVIIISVIAFNVFAQNKQVPATEILYSNSGSTNDMQSLTPVKPAEVQFSTQKQNLLNQLEAARSSNNKQLKEQIEEQINQLDGTHSVQMIENTNTTGGMVNGDNNHGSNNEQDYLNSTIVFGQGIWSSATQTESGGMPHPGRVWVATGIYTSTGSDTCKIFYSDNAGLTWNYAYYFYFFNNVNFRAGELDLELVYDGTNLWIMGVAGCADLTTNRTNGFLFRFNTSTGVFSGYTLFWPGYTSTTNKYYNPRITSDNSNYTTATYIYISSAFDSTYNITAHVNKLKYAHLTSPFAASPVINYSMPSGGGFFWYTSAVPSTSYLWSDLAYFRTSAGYNRVITVYNVPASGNYNIYLAWSDDYGVTVTGSSTLVETNADFGTRIAFNGGTSNLTGMITYVRQYSGNDWDPYFRNTIDGGANWTSGMIDPDVQRCRSIDVIALRGASNKFKAAFTQDYSTGTKGYYSGFVVNSFSQPAPTAVTLPGVDTVYTKAIAGYLTGGGDDCFAIYSMGSGSGLQSSRLCISTLGISNNNNGIPSTFSLQQNYPNPFNPTTNISFGIASSSVVKLVVYDMTGKTVETLVNGNMNAGSYNYSFNASSLASGVYFYRMDVKSSDGVNNFSAVKKMMLVK